jgi:hypothetical protein
MKSSWRRYAWQTVGATHAELASSARGTMATNKQDQVQRVRRRKERHLAVDGLLKTAMVKDILDVKLLNWPRPRGGLV